ncbi:MAG: FAD-binding oxidoreductase [Acidobacteria bacterium]|nr:MAG: FAD-binding oxidoreductase [Acidobacteriota bacterium]MCE7957438.1 FAD-binding oxidoreductase [Acidobacteria bacterium ACB2]
MKTRDEVLASLRVLLGEGAVVVEPHELERYEKGWRYGRGKALAAVRPSSTEEVSHLLRLASANGVRVVAQGGNTGLVGASTPDGSGEMLVLSLERLSRTLEVDPVEKTVTADGGVLLGRIDAALAEHGLLFPIDLGADPSIGGMVATNTGGTRLLRYGDVRQNLLGLEAVLADGTVLDLTRPLRKNNTGFDARQLFVGTSGVLGIVTKVVLRVVPRPVQRVTALVGLSSGAAVLGLLAHLEGRLGEVLTAFEAIGAGALAPVFRHQPRLRDPFGGRHPAYAVLVELSSTLGADRLALDDLLESALTERLEAEGGGGITDVFLGKPTELWEIRHGVSESLRNEGEVLAFDVSVPRSSMAAFVEAARATVAAGWPFVRFCDYGHWGDGGVHVNLVWSAAEAPRPAADLKAELQPRLYDLAVSRFRGSYSAEHGVGPHNQAFYDLYTPELVKEVCRLLKERLDPSGLLGTVRLG